MFKKVAKVLSIAFVSFAVFFSVSAGTKQQSSNAAQIRSFSSVKKVASSKIGKSYRMGAVGPDSFDCSGYTKYVFKQGAKKGLQRTAQQQYNSAKHVSVKHLKKGDLVFFGGNRGSISHVGLYVGGGKMIDAQNSGVKQESIHAPWWHLVAASRPVAMR